MYDILLYIYRPHIVNGCSMLLTSNVNVKINKLIHFIHFTVHIFCSHLIFSDKLKYFGCPLTLQWASEIHTKVKNSELGPVARDQAERYSE